MPASYTFDRRSTLGLLVVNRAVLPNYFRGSRQGLRFFGQAVPVFFFLGELFPKCIALLPAWDHTTPPAPSLFRRSLPATSSHLTSRQGRCSLECQVKMPIQILQGTLDLMILRTLATMGPQHAYGIASRLQQVSEDALNLNQGTIYPALVRIEQHGWTRGSWGRTENNREAKYYTITRAGLKALNEETERWRQMAAVVEKLLTEET